MGWCISKQSFCVVDPGELAGPSLGHTGSNYHPHLHSHMGSISESSINLTVMFLGSGRKPE